MNFGQNLYNWFLSNAQSLVLMAIVVIGIYLGFKREFSKLIGFAFCGHCGAHMLQPYGRLCNGAYIHGKHSPVYSACIHNTYGRGNAQRGTHSKKQQKHMKKRCAVTCAWCII